LRVQEREEPYKLRVENFTELIYIGKAKYPMTPREHSLEGLRLVLLPLSAKSRRPLFCREVNIGGEYHPFIFVRRDYFGMGKSDMQMEFELYHELGHIVLGHLLEIRWKRMDPLERARRIKNGEIHPFEMDADRYAVGKVGKKAGMYSLSRSINRLAARLEQYGPRVDRERRERTRITLVETQIRREIIRKM
jgi:hypothetical protein